MADPPTQAFAGGDLMMVEGEFSAPVPEDPQQTLPRPRGGPLRGLARRVTRGPENALFRQAVRVRAEGWRAYDASRLALRRIGRRGETAAPGFRSVLVNGCRVRAQVRPDASAAWVHSLTLQVLSNALHADGVLSFAVPVGDGTTRIGVRRSDLEAVLTALSQHQGDGDLYVGAVRPARVVGLERVGNVDPTQLAEVRELLLTVPMCSPDGRHVLALEGAVHLDLWYELADGVLGAPQRNRYTPYLSPVTLREPARVVVAGVELETFAEMAQPHVQDIHFPIDVVYTWVDGDDPAWNRRMQVARDRTQGRGHEPRGLAQARYRGLDELRYSLRSLAAFAPWVNHVWIVTDDQAPVWLAPGAPGLTVVDHCDIWSDRSVLPVFNSHAIESQLHHIEGLTEHYVYFNDDVFLGRTVPPQRFFSPGGSAVFYPANDQIGSGPATLHEGAAAAAAKNNRSLLLDCTGTVPTVRLRHTAHAQRRSVGYELERRYPEAFAATAAARFRAPRDLAPVPLQLWYALHDGRSVTADCPSTYLDLVQPAARAAGMSRLAGSRDQDMFCLNQSDDPALDPVELRSLVSSFLEDYFPFVSPWENPDM